MKKLFKKDVGESKLTFIGACNTSKCIAECKCTCAGSTSPIGPVWEGAMTGPMYGPAQANFNVY